MELKFHGANCLSIATKQGRFVIDDNLLALGLKAIHNKDDVLLSTTPLTETTNVAFKIDSPGEYEIKGLSVIGIPARGHMEVEDKHGATIYKIIGEDYSIVILGHIYPNLDEDQLETLGHVDVLCVPVGGNGYTLDATGAIKVIRKIEPRIVVPTHYADPAIKYEVPQTELEVFSKEIGIEAETGESFKAKQLEATDKLRIVKLG